MLEISVAFAEDKKVAELLKQATAFRNDADWSSAVLALVEAKRLMLISEVAYPAETWCRLPLYLQHAGMFDESMAEFQFLLDDLDRRARRDARVDDPTVGPQKRKLEAYKGIIRWDKKVIRDKRSLATARESNKAR